MTPSRVVLNVSGGIVQDVFSSDSAIEVIVIDWDVEGADLGASDFVEIDDGYGGISGAFVSRPRIHPISKLAGTEAAAAMRKAGISDAEN